MTAITTCQICARAIKSKSGLIAHHGYQRPGDGWQTSSCMGARFRPYEVACDALPPAIEAVAHHIERMTATLAEWKANPPNAIQCERERRDRRNSWDKYMVQWSVIRPADFDPSADAPNANQAPWDSMPERRSNYGFRPCDIRTYAAVYADKLKGFAADIKASTDTLAYFRKRLADWKAPTPV